MTKYAGQWGPEDIEYAGGGNAAGAQVAITDGNDQLIPLYTDYTKILPAANPTEVDARGNLTFFADPGSYRLHVHGAVIPIVVQTHPMEPIELPAFEGDVWWYGDGPPDLVVGSKAGDQYLDLTTGTVYELE